MSEHETPGIDRRTFLQSGALVTAAAIGSIPAAGAQEQPAKLVEIPRRTLGKTGVQVTMLEQGTVLGSGFDRIMRLSYAGGVRVFDTAKVYRSEPLFKKWFDQAPEVRKQIFLVTKDMVRRPSEMLKMVDERLAALGTDYIDLFFIHGLGDDHSLDDAINMVKSQEFKDVAEAMRKSGKARFIGFSTHHKNRAQIIQAAAEGESSTRSCSSITPGSTRTRRSTRPSTPAGRQGIGLISMKQIAGHVSAIRPRETSSRTSSRRCPCSRSEKLSPFQGLLHAIWTDERISCVCVVDAEHRPDPREHRRRPPLRAAEGGRDPPAPRRLPRRRADALRRLRRPLLDRRRHQGRAGQPDPVPHLSRAPRRSAPRPAASMPSSPPRPATGPAPTSKPPAPPAPTSSTSPGSCPKWIGTWPESIV